MKISILKINKSIPAGTDIELPRFTVLIGKNGSGKTHFLEAIAAKDGAKVTCEDKLVQPVRFVHFNGLNPNVIESCDPLQLSQKTKQIWQTLTQSQGFGLGGRPPLGAISKVAFSDEQRTSLIKEIEGRSEKPIGDITEDEFRDVFDYSLIDSGEIFTAGLADIFKSYQVKLEDNEYRKYRSSIGENLTTMNEGEFVSAYGPKPWDMVNSILEKANLPYRVNNPLGQNKDSTFSLRLTDTNSGIDISFKDLSTGERVLMSLALAVYKTGGDRSRVKLLLLDEPDAALHPEFSKFLVDAIKLDIVERANVSVIMTTHSPITVAACNEESIYEMSKIEHRPIKRSKSDAMKVLSDGISNLFVSIEDRRQVFVESSYDAGYYERLFHILKRSSLIRTDVTPLFIPPHNRSGSNCDDVISIVKFFQKFESNLVYGIVDGDNVRSCDDAIIVTGDGNRYSVENYIFDPLAVACLLIRERIISGAELGESRLSTYMELKSIGQEDIQKLSDYVLKELALDNGEKMTAEYIGGYRINLTAAFCSAQGHALEDLIVSKWPQLNAIRKGKNNDNLLKNHIIETVFSDMPNLISRDIVETFLKIK